MPGQLFGRDSVFAFGEKKNGKEPSLEAGLRLVENRSGCRGNLSATPRARIGPTLGYAVEAAGLAALANIPLKPSAENEVQTGRVVRELRVKVFKVVAHFVPRLSRANTNHCTQAGGVRRPLSQSCTVRTLRVGAIFAAASLCESLPRAVEKFCDQSINSKVVVGVAFSLGHGRIFAAVKGVVCVGVSSNFAQFRHCVAGGERLHPEPFLGLKRGQNVVGNAGGSFALPALVENVKITHGPIPVVGVLDSGFYCRLHIFSFGLVSWFHAHRYQYYTASPYKSQQTI